MPKTFAYHSITYPSKAIPFKFIPPTKNPPIETIPAITFPEPPFREAPSSPQSQKIMEIPSYEGIKETGEEVAVLIHRLARIIFSSPIGSARVSEDKLYGLFVEVEVFGDMRESLGEWLKLIDVLKVLGINIPVYPKILGRFNVASGEFGRFIGLGLAKMKVPLKLEKPIDITELISQERGK